MVLYFFNDQARRTFMPRGAGEGRAGQIQIPGENAEEHFSRAECSRMSV